MRQKKEQGGVDLTKPLNLDQYKPDGTCYGQLWDSTVVDCNNCASSTTCGILYHNLNKVKAKAIEDKGAAFLDTASFTKIAVSKLEEYAKTGGGTKGMLALVKSLSGMEDTATCINYLKTYISNHKNIKTVGGVVIWT